MIGDTFLDDGTEFEVVWSGGEGLIPDRESRPSDLWEPPKRAYNKKSDYWTKESDSLDKVTESADTTDSIEPQESDEPMELENDDE